MTGQVWPTALKTVAIKHPVNIDTPLTVHTVCVEVDVEYCLPLLNETRLHLLICFFSIRPHATLGAGQALCVYWVGCRGGREPDDMRKGK